MNSVLLLARQAAFLLSQLPHPAVFPAFPRLTRRPGHPHCCRQPEELLLCSLKCGCHCPRAIHTASWAIAMLTEDKLFCQALCFEWKMPELWGRETKEDQAGPATVPWKTAVLAMTSGISAQDRASGKLHEEAPFHRGQWKSPEGHI